MLGSHQWHSRVSTAFGTFALIATFFASHASQSQIVEEISIVAGAQDSGSGNEWFFLIEAFGANLTSVSVAPPTGGPLVLTDPFGVSDFEFEDGPFSTFSALQAVYPAGDYVVTVEGTETVTLAWNPVEPVGMSGQPSLAIDSPADGATGVSSMPDFAFSFDCTNCKDLSLEIFDVFTDGFAGNLNFGELDVTPGTFTNPIPFASMQSDGGPPAALPDGLAEAEFLIGLATFTSPTFDAPSALPAFEYIDAAAIFANSVFSVPEPSPELATLAVLGTLLVLSWHRRPVRG